MLVLKTNLTQKLVMQTQTKTMVHKMFGLNGGDRPFCFQIHHLVYPLSRSNAGDSGHKKRKIRKKMIECEN